MYEKNRKNKTSSLDVLLEKGYEPAAEDPEHLIDRIDGRIAIQLIKHLPEKYQKILRMRYLQGLSLKEISLITSQSKNAVTVQMHRGLLKLKQLYKTFPYKKEIRLSS